MAPALERLPAHVRATYSFFLVNEQDGREMAIAVNDLPVHLEFGSDTDPRAVVRLLDLSLADDLLDDWRFMTADETKDYLDRRNAGEIDDDEEA